MIRKVSGFATLSRGLQRLTDEKILDHLQHRQRDTAVGAEVEVVGLLSWQSHPGQGVGAYATGAQ